MISSVSGGSLGNLYYFDRHVYGTGAFTASDAAGASSLSATVWGITYVDGPRLLLGSSLNPLDRGWAQEFTWSHHLDKPDQTLADIAANVANGDHPLPIFNACFQETGQRFLLSPAPIAYDKPHIAGSRGGRVRFVSSDPRISGFRRRLGKRLATDRRGPSVSNFSIRLASSQVEFLATVH